MSQWDVYLIKKKHFSFNTTLYKLNNLFHQSVSSPVSRSGVKILVRIQSFEKMSHGRGNLKNEQVNRFTATKCQPCLMLHGRGGLFSWDVRTPGVPHGEGNQGRKLEHIR